MALQFQQPNVQPGRSKYDALQETTGQLPSLLMQYHQFKRQRELDDINHKIAMAELDNKKTELEIRKQALSNPNKANSIDALLAQRVKDGELTLEQAIELKARANPGNTNVIGSQDGSLVTWNPKTQETGTVKLPGNGPLMSTTVSEGQANASLFGQRAKEADSQINDIANRIDLTGVKAGLMGLKLTPNVMKSPEIQSYEQSKRNFLTAVLRRESGAVINASETADGNEQYFPQYGDSPEVLQQKALNRATAIKGLMNAAGGAANSISEQKNNLNNGPVKIKGDDDYNSLPSGSQFIGPDGVLRRKP